MDGVLTFVILYQSLLTLFYHANCHYQDLSYTLEIEMHVMLVDVGIGDDIHSQPKPTEGVPSFLGNERILLL